MLVSAQKKPPKAYLNDNTKLLEINSGKTAKKPGNSTGATNLSRDILKFQRVAYNSLPSFPWQRNLIHVLN